jgi:hypothetical protein
MAVSDIRMRRFTSLAFQHHQVRSEVLTAMSVSLMMEAVRSSVTPVIT